MSFRGRFPTHTLPSLEHAMRALQLFTVLIAVTATPAALAAGPIAGTLDFNALAPANGGIPVPGGFGGFQWGSSVHAMTLPSAPADAFVAFSGTAISVSRVDGADFWFDGADFWSRRGADANGSFYFVLSNDGQVVFDGRADSQNRMRFTGTHAFMTSGYSGPIDYMAITFGQGGDDWDHLAFDNFTYRATPLPALPAVPEPATGALFMAGLGLLAAGARIRSGRAA